MTGGVKIAQTLSLQLYTDHLAMMCKIKLQALMSLTKSNPYTKLRGEMRLLITNSSGFTIINKNN